MEDTAKNSSLRAGDVKAGAEATLAARYGEREAKAMVRVIFEEVMGWKPIDLVLRSDYLLTAHSAERIWSITERVAAGEPIQQVVGWADFYGLRFKVTRDTLIPRPETAELVDIIVKEASGRNDLDILDCGTGSGCIAITLARALPFPNVEGIDLSERALKIAAENAKELKTPVKFSLRDMLSLAVPDKPCYDIIVSNPPYIAESEAAAMEKNVLDHEPRIALFVPDDNPLIYYTAIGSYAHGALRPGGKLYFEINPMFARRLVQEIRGMGFTDVITERDDRGNTRFLIASR